MRSALRQQEESATVVEAEKSDKAEKSLIDAISFVNPPDAVVEELLNNLRDATLQVVDAIGRWKMEREVKLAACVWCQAMSDDKLTCSWQMWF